uniref:Neuropathy target esterase sws n=1 Tax=Trichobilharzia regenti TaxID=157069 RepID=A0AA85JUW5_TRIRE|nr:unnamed protein product [Trichobilharzia regenti]
MQTQLSFQVNSSAFSAEIFGTFHYFTQKIVFSYYEVLLSIKEGVLAEIFPSLLLSYNATVLLILLIFLLGLSTFLVVRHIKSHVPLQVHVTQVSRGFRRRDKIRYHAIRFGRRFSEITEELKKARTKEERKATIVNFAKKIFNLHDAEKYPALAYGRLPESFFEPDEEDVHSLPEDLRLMISSIRVFGHLEKSFFINFCRFIETINLNKGEYLFRIGDEDKCVYVVRSGRIQITVTEPDGSKFVISEVEKGGSVDSLLSVLSILTGYPSTFEFMEAVAVEPTTVLCLPTRSFLEICKPKTPALFRIIQMITVRLQRLSFNALHTYLGLSSELINKDGPPFPGSSKANKFLSEIFEKKPHMKDFDEFGNISSKYSDSKDVLPKARSSLSTTLDDQQFGNFCQEIEQAFPAEDSLILDSASQSNALELGEAPIFCGKKNTNGVKSSPSQPPSPTFKRRFTNLRRAHSLLDTSSRRKGGSDNLNKEKENDNPKLASERYKLTNEMNFTDEEVKTLLKLAEDDLACLLNLNDPSILHGSIKLFSVPSDFVLSRESEMQMEMYYVLFGELQALQSIGGVSNEVVTMFTCGQGKVVGLLGLITGEPNIYSVKAKTNTIVAVFSRECFYAVVRQYPEALFSVTHIASSHLSPLLHQLDFAMEWISVKSGKALYKKGDDAHHVYVVLSGRLRQVDNMTGGGHRIVSELGRGDLVGFLEVISEQTRIYTVMAVRDSELAQIPSHLLHYLKNKVPQVLTRIIQLLSNKLLGNLTTDSSMASPLGMPILHMTTTSPLVNGGLGYTSGRNSNMDVLYSQLNSGVMANLRTIAVLPSTADINAEAFTLELQHSMSPMGSSVRLTSDIALKRLGSSAFDSISQYRLSTWLSHQEDSHRIVFFVCDCQRASAWNRICIRQADCILVLALVSSDPARPSPIEMALKNDPTKVAKVLVLMYPLDTDYPESGKTAIWLNARPWISQHYHIRCEPRVFIPRSKRNLISFYSKVFAREKPNPLSDFSRLARYLAGEAVGLVLGGGGARGCSHVGLIRAFQEAGIPIDLVGGTSIGAFMSALWADETRVAQFTQRARNFTNCFNSIWNKIKDFTYPAVSIFSGKELNHQLISVFHDRQIEDFWIPCFCVTTDITNCKMRIHTQGSVWRYIRASITYPPLDPPICDPYDGALLVDGAFINNVPADIMVCFGAKTIFANDVGAAVETELTNYGDHLSGWYFLYNRFFGVGSSVLRIPSLTEIQARLAYISCVRQLEYVKASGICHYLRPPIDKYLTLQFSAFDEINNVGYEYIKRLLNTWHEEGRLQTLIPGVKPHISSPGGVTTFGTESQSTHLSPLQSPECTISTASNNWLTQSFGDQIAFIDLAECLAETNKGQEYDTLESSGTDERPYEFYTTDSINVRDFANSPDFPSKITNAGNIDTSVCTASTNVTTYNSSGTNNMKIFSKSTQNSRHAGTDRYLQPGSILKKSSPNEQTNYEAERKSPIDDLLKDNFKSHTKIRRRRFFSECYDTTVDTNSVLKKCNLYDSHQHTPNNMLPRYKSDHDIAQTNVTMSIDEMNYAPKTINYSLSSFKSLEDDGYLEDDESSTDSGHSPFTASDPELRHDIYPESSNTEERRMRQRSRSAFRIPTCQSYISEVTRRPDSPHSDASAKIQYMNNNKAVASGSSSHKYDTNSMRNRTKQNRRRHHRSSLDRLRSDRGVNHPK